MGQKPRQIVLILILIVLLGLVIRLYELDKRTMTHVEIYVPGIALPENLSDPKPRLTLMATLTSLIGTQEPHPPGYYIFMLGWTHLTGSGIGWLRLPSAILGSASILLLFLLGKQEKNPITGLLAAFLAALNGHQVFWSQLARGYMPAEFFGLASSVFLLLALKGGKRERLFQLTYLLLVLAGVSLIIYFWPILFVQMLWVLVEKRREHSLPGIFQVQYLALLIGSPLISLAIFQMRRESYLSTNFWPSLARYLGFGYAVEEIPAEYAAQLWIQVIPYFLLVIGIICLIAGIKNARQATDSSSSKGIPTSVHLAVTLFSTLAIFVTGKYFSTEYLQAGRTMMLSAILPGFLFILYIGLRYLWERRGLGKGEFRPGDIYPGSNYKLSAYLAVIPVVLVASATPISAIFASRGVLLYTPYLLLTLSAGMLVLIKRSRLWIPVLLLILFTLPVGGILFRHSSLEHPVDYKALAENWIPEIQDADLIFIQKHWATTPMFYYLDANKYQVIGDLQPDSYTKAIRNHPNSRVWVFPPPNLSEGVAIKQALAGYKLIENIQAKGVHVDLYEKQ